VTPSAVQATDGSSVSSRSTSRTSRRSIRSIRAFWTRASRTGFSSGSRSNASPRRVRVPVLCDQACRLVRFRRRFVAAHQAVLELLSSLACSDRRRSSLSACLACRSWSWFAIRRRDHSTPAAAARDMAPEMLAMMIAVVSDVFVGALPKSWDSDCSDHGQMGSPPCAAARVGQALGRPESRGSSVIFSVWTSGRKVH
jgi:hypothetical protein